MWGLDNVINNFRLTRAQLARIRETDESDAGVIDSAYGVLANDFGKLFDPGFVEKALETPRLVDARIWELRRIFYRMILGKSVMEIKTAVGVIVDHMGLNINDKEQVIEAMKQYRDNKTVWNAIVDKVTAANGGRYPRWWSELLARLSLI